MSRAPSNTVTPVLGGVWVWTDQVAAKSRKATTGKYEEIRFRYRMKNLQPFEPCGSTSVGNGTEIVCSGPFLAPEAPGRNTREQVDRNISFGVVRDYG
jgi:hypothetical protein